MAAINFTPISLYYTTTASAVPSAGNLVDGELALNITDKKLYAKDNAGSVFLLASEAGTTGTVSSVAVSGGTTGLTTSGGPITTSGTITLAGTLATANGGTNLTSFTSGGVMYASSSSALTTGSAVTYSSGTFSLNVASAYYKALVPAGSASYLGDGVSLVSGAGATDSALRFDGTNLLISYSNTERIRVNSTGAIGLAGANYGSSGQVLTSAGSGSTPTWTTPAAGVSLSANNTWTGTQTFNGTTSILATVLKNAAETTTIDGGSLSGSTTCYVTAQSVIYFTANATGNWVQNITGNSGVDLNTILSTGQSITVAIMCTQGGTAYYNTSVQIDGTTSGVTTKWQGGTAPTAGNASSIDVYTYTIVKTASATFTVFASQTKFA